MPKPAAAKKLAPNHHHSLVGGLHQDEELLCDLVEVAAEDEDLDESDADVTDALVEAAKEYDAALASALDELVVKYPPADGSKADALWDANGPFLVLMTLRGEGAGIGDGDWDAFYPSGLDDVKRFLKSKLGRFADDTGGGRLEDALVNAAWDTCGDEDEGDSPDSSDDDDGDEEEDDEDED